MPRPTKEALDARLGALIRDAEAMAKYATILESAGGATLEPFHHHRPKMLSVKIESLRRLMYGDDSPVHRAQKLKQLLEEREEEKRGQHQ